MCVFLRCSPRVSASATKIAARKVRVVVLSNSTKDRKEGNSDKVRYMQCILYPYTHNIYTISGLGVAKTHTDFQSGSVRARYMFFVPELRKIRDSIREIDLIEL